MKKCGVCQAPLEGPASKWARIFPRRSPSKDDPALCGRCAKKKKPNASYVCQICLRPVDEADALTHVKAEEYLLELILKDHPEWKEENATCPRCIGYYRELKVKAKI